MSEPDLSVTDDPAASRFILRLDGELVGSADYSFDGDVVTIPYMETVRAHRGNGYAAVLLGRIVESVRANGQTIRPLCSYAASYLRERPETHDLLAR